MKLINKIQAFCGIVLLGAASAVSALPLITGEIGMGGDFAAVDSAWNSTSLNSATGIDFTPSFFIVNGTSGSFSGVYGVGNITDFQFGAGTGSELGIRSNPSVSSITDFWTIDGFAFELISVVKLASSSDTFLDLEGTGVISAAGFENTVGSWSFTGDNTNATFSWSAGSQPVPEPKILALMGIGLVGLLVSRRV